MPEKRDDTMFSICKATDDGIKQIAEKTDEVDELNKRLELSGYRVSYKWWFYRVWKTYKDGREHPLVTFTSLEHVYAFLEEEGVLL